jgi:Replication-relaxation
MNYWRRVNMNSRYERPEVKQITRQWVRENGHNITQRDIGLLKMLADHRLLRRDQIQTLYPEFPSTDFLNKRLNILYKKHFIDKIYPSVGLGKGSSKQHICLDRAGIIFLELEGYNKPIRTDKDGSKSLPLGWEHVVMVNDYHCKIKEFFKGEGNGIIKSWTEEPLPYNDTRLIPDIMFIAKYGGKGYLFCIEVDLGTEDVPYVKKKLSSYTDYYLSKMWLGTEWAKVFKTPTFPRVLLMTENGRTKRVNSLREHVKDSGIRFFVEEHQHFMPLLKHIVKG